MANVYPSDVQLQMMFSKAAEMTVYLPFDGDADDDSDNALTPSTESGGIIYSSEYAAFGQAIQLAEATTNEIQNPSLENNITDFWQQGTYWQAKASDWSRSTARAWVGSASMKQVNSSGFNDIWYKDVTGLTSGGTYALQVRVYIESGTFRGVALTGAGGGYSNNEYSVNDNGNTTDETETGRWILYTLVKTLDVGSTSARLHFRTDNVGDTVYLDGWQLEEKAYPTPYCDGSLGTGHSWSGSAHASTSSRTATDPRYTLDLPSQFTISQKLFPFTLPSEISADGWYWQWRFDANNLIGLRADESSDAVVFEWIGAGSSDTIADVDLTRFQEYEYTVTYDGTTVTLYRDGTSIGTISSPTAHGTTPDVLHLGAVSGASHANCWLDEFVVDDRAWTAQEVLTHYERGIAFEGVWTDIIEDHVGEQDPFVANYGIQGVGPLELLGHAGQMSFALDNSAQNSGGAQGYYSPGHTNVRTGFQQGIDTRLVFAYGGTSYYKWRGRVQQIKPTPGSKADQKTRISCRDWISASSEIKPQFLAVQTSKTGDELLTTLLANVDEVPPASDLDVGLSTFAYTWDEVRDGNTTVYEILRAIAISEFGQIIQIGDSSQGATLQFENRQARVLETSLLIEMDQDGDDDDFQAMEVEDALGNIYNLVRGEVYPRVVDATADQVLWKLQGDAPSIGPGETITIVGKFTDPDQRISRIAGMDIVTPVAGTDYEFSTGNGNLDVTATLGGNSVKFELTNTGAGSGTVDTLQVRGKRVLIYQPALAVSEDATSQTDYGERPLSMSLPYQDDPLEAQDFVDITKARWKDAGLLIGSVSFWANRSDALMTAFLTGEPGKRIAVQEPVTGLDRECFINGVTFRLWPAAGEIKIWVTWMLARASDSDYWILGTSRLGSNPLGF